MSTKDLHGLALTAASPETARSFNHAVEGYLAYRADAPQRLRPLLAADPEFALAHVLKGYFSDALLQSRQPARRPRRAGDRAPAVGGRTCREQAHVAALAHWVDGDIDATLASGRRSSTSIRSMCWPFACTISSPSGYGRPDLMAAQADAALQRWSPELPGWPALLACRCFAHEEMGNYAIAEASGRQAIALAPGDLWAAHGVAHVMEMQGRHDEGIAWLAGLEPHWEGGNNLKHHLWWHRGLYHFERREFAEVLASTTATSATSPRRSRRPARHLHRRAERGLHAVPAGAPRRRRRRPLERTRRQGRSTHRRLPLGLHRCRTG